MTFTLPIVGDSSGVWGDILNTTLTDMDGRITSNTTLTTANGTSITTINGQITTINGKITALEARPAGGLTVGTTGSLPAVAIGQITLATDTGYMSYGASISGVATRVPWPGSYLAKVKQTSTQNFTTSNGAALQMQAADTNRLNGWTSGSRYVAPVRGLYEFTGGITYGGNVTGYRSAMWYLNGAAFNGGGAQIAAGPGTVSTTVVARTCVTSMNVGDYVELWGAQNSGSTLATDITTTVQSGMQVKYLGYYGN